MSARGHGTCTNGAHMWSTVNMVLVLIAYIRALEAKASAR